MFRTKLKPMPAGSRWRSGNKRWLILGLIMLLSCGTPENTWRVATFNIRFGAAEDGENHWTQRKSILFDCLRELQPTVMGTQEGLSFQLAEICQAFPHLKYVGVGRYHQVEVDRAYERLSGEHCAIFYDTTQVSLEQSGTFWLSETPEIAGSQSWGNDLARIVTWAILRARSQAPRFIVFNTHYHWGEPFATRSTELLLRQIKTLAASLPVIVLGDFNVPPTSSIHARFTQPDSLPPDFRPFQDVWESLGQIETAAGTFHDYTGQPKESRIDWILISPDFKPLSVQKITYQQAGRYPSDHFPVLAVLQLR